LVDEGILFWIKFHEIEIMFILIYIGIPVLLLCWFVRLIIQFSRGKVFFFEALTFFFLMIALLWNLGIFPLSKNFYVKEVAEQITGKSFWSWEVYSYEDLSVRGEGYSLLIFRFDEPVAAYFKQPGRAFFEHYPKELDYRSHWERAKWKRTPVLESDQKIVNIALTKYSGGRDVEIEKVDLVRSILDQPNSYYAYNHKNGDVDLFVLAPEEKLIILVNLNN